MQAQEDSDHVLKFWIGGQGSIRRETFEKELNFHFISYQVVIFEDLEETCLCKILIALIDFLKRQGLATGLTIIFGVLVKYLSQPHIS